MIKIDHPSSCLKHEWIKSIREESMLAEQQGSLTDTQLELIYEQAWFKLFVPETTISLPESLFLEEALSWADGSLGWTVTLCSGAGWFGGFFNSDLATEVFKDRTVCIGGSGAPMGTAIRTENGYLISGRWKYATGADHLTHFTANCIIKESDEIVLDQNGENLILPFVFKKEEVKIIKDWDTIGLIATSSQSFEVKGLFVASYRCFTISQGAQTDRNPVYKYPFLQFAEVTLAVNISGMAIHFVDCCGDIFAKRIESKKLKKSQQTLLIESLNNSENKLTKIRSEFYELVERSWQMFIKDNVVAEEVLEDISLTSRKLAAVSHEIVYQLYPLCGLEATNPKSEINRVWRDIHTASQHSLLTFP